LYAPSSLLARPSELSLGSRGAHARGRGHWAGESGFSPKVKSSHMEVRRRPPPPPPCSPRALHASRASPCLHHSEDPRPRGPRVPCARGSPLRAASTTLRAAAGLPTRSSLQAADRACVRCACPCLTAGCPVAGPAARRPRAQSAARGRSLDPEASGPARSTTPPPLQRRKFRRPAFET